MDSTWLKRSGSLDLAELMNAIPGVWMETRGNGGSRRIQIRSSGLRSPFAVRNVTQIQDGFILTSADGTSPLEWWTPVWLTSVDVLSGPSGAAYGAGYGGVIHGSTAGPPSVSGGTFSVMKGLAAKGAFDGSRGDYDLWGQWYQKSKNHLGGWRIAVQQSENDGFRTHESNSRFHLDGHWWRNQWVRNSLIKHHLWAGFLNTQWDLPGSITAEARDTMPTASPGQMFDAHVDRTSSLLAYSIQQIKGDEQQKGLWMNILNSDKYNPFGTSRFYQGVKREKEAHLNLRAQLIQRISKTNGWTWMAEGSGSLQAERRAISEWDTLAPPIEQTLRYEMSIEALRSWVGLSFRGTSPRGLRWEAQIAGEYFQRSQNGNGGEDGITPFSADYRRWSVHPRMTVSKRLATTPHRFFLTAGSGASDPTSFELMNPESLLPSSLKTEIARSWEWGWRHPHFTVVAYAMRITDAIVTVPGPTDAPVTENTGRLSMRGLEFMFKQMWSIQEFTSVQCELGVNWPHHENAKQGQKLPGTPRSWLTSRGTIQHKSWRLDVLATYRNEVPLNDEGTAWGEPVMLLDGVIRYQQGGKKGIEFKLGLRNAMQQNTSNWWQLNAFGRKYYNPAPGRQMWAQVVIPLRPKPTAQSAD